MKPSIPLHGPLSDKILSLSPSKEITEDILLYLPNENGVFIMDSDITNILNSAKVVGQTPTPVISQTTYTSVVTTPISFTATISNFDVSATYGLSIDNPKVCEATLNTVTGEITIHLNVLSTTDTAKIYIIAQSVGLSSSNQGVITVTTINYQEIPDDTIYFLNGTDTPNYKDINVIETDIVTQGDTTVEEFNTQNNLLSSVGGDKIYLTSNTSNFSAFIHSNGIDKITVDPDTAKDGVTVKIGNSYIEDIPGTTVYTTTNPFSSLPCVFTHYDNLDYCNLTKTVDVNKNDLSFTSGPIISGDGVIPFATAFLPAADGWTTNTYVYNGKANQNTRYMYRLSGWTNNTTNGTNYYGTVNYIGILKNSNGVTDVVDPNGWSTTPHTLPYNAAAKFTPIILGNYLYLIGGGVEDQGTTIDNNTTTYRAALDAVTGMIISDFTAGVTVPAMSSPELVVTNNKLFITISNAGNISNIYTLDIDSGFNLSNLQTITTPIITAPYADIYKVFKTTKYLYVIGAEVHYTPINANGTIGTWADAGDINQSLCTSFSSIIVTTNMLYVYGLAVNGSNVILEAPIVNGVVGNLSVAYSTTIYGSRELIVTDTTLLACAFDSEVGQTSIVSFTNFDGWAIDNNGAITDVTTSYTPPDTYKYYVKKSETIPVVVGNTLNGVYTLPSTIVNNVTTELDWVSYQDSITLSNPENIFVSDGGNKVYINSVISAGSNISTNENGFVVGAIYNEVITTPGVITQTSAYSGWSCSFEFYDNFQNTYTLSNLNISSNQYDSSTQISGVPNPSLALKAFTQSNIAYNGSSNFDYVLLRTSSRIYKIGGYAGATEWNTVSGINPDLYTNSKPSSYYMTVDPNSDVLSRWVNDVSVSTLPNYQLNGISLVIGNYAYIFGGRKVNSDLTLTNLNTIYRASIDSNGVLGSWNAYGFLPLSIVGLGNAIVTNGYVYLVVSNRVDSTTPASNKILKATIDSSGNIGTLTDMNQDLPNSNTVSISATQNFIKAFKLNNYIVALVNNTTTITVYTASINSDGSIGSWVNANCSITNSQALINVDVIVYNSIAYLMVMGNASTSSYYIYKLINNNGVFTTTLNNTLPYTYNQSTGINSIGGYNGFIVLKTKVIWFQNLSTSTYAATVLSSWDSSVNGQPAIVTIKTPDISTINYYFKKSETTPPMLLTQTDTYLLPNLQTRTDKDTAGVIATASYINNILNSVTRLVTNGVLSLAIKYNKITTNYSFRMIQHKIIYHGGTSLVNAITTMMTKKE